MLPPAVSVLPSVCPNILNSHTASSSDRVTNRHQAEGSSGEGSESLPTHSLSPWRLKLADFIRYPGFGRSAERKHQGPSVSLASLRLSKHPKNPPRLLNFSFEARLTVY